MRYTMRNLSVLLVAVVLQGLALVPQTVPAAAQHARTPQGIDMRPLQALTTHKGSRLDLTNLRRKPYAVVFGFTHCPDICPTTLLHMKTLLDDLGPEAKSFPVLFVTVDPERDTVEVLSKYVTSFDERIVGLTGTPLDIEAVAHAFGAFYERQAPSGAGYSVDHTTRVYLMDAFGLLAEAHDPATEAAKLKVTIAKLLRQQR